MAKSELFVVSKKGCLESVSDDFNGSKHFYGVDDIIFHHLARKYNIFNFSILNYSKIETLKYQVNNSNNPIDIVLLSLVDNGVFFLEDKDKVADYLMRSVIEFDGGFTKDIETVEDYCYWLVSDTLVKVAKNIEQLPINAGEFFVFRPTSFDPHGEISLLGRVDGDTYSDFLKKLLPDKDDDKLYEIACLIKGKIDDVYADLNVVHIEGEDFAKAKVTLEPLEDYYGRTGHVNSINYHIDENTGILRRLLNEIYYDMSIPIPEKKEKMVALLKGLGVEEYEAFISKYYRFDVGENTIHKGRIKELKALCVMIRIFNQSTLEPEEMLKRKMAAELVKLGYSNPMDYLNVYYVFDDYYYDEGPLRLIEILDSIYFNEDLSLHSRYLWMIKEATDVLGNREKAIEFIEQNNNRYHFNIRECDVKKLFKNGNK